MRKWMYDSIYASWLRMLLINVLFCPFHFIILIMNRIFFLVLYDMIMTCHLVQNIFGNLRVFLEKFSGYWNVLFSGDNVTTEICYSNYCSFGRFKLAIFGRLRYLTFGKLQYFNFWEIEMCYFREIKMCHFWEIEMCHFREIEICHIREMAMCHFRETEMCYFREIEMCYFREIEMYDIR